jgi:paraquat-inducible protein B
VRTMEQLSEAADSVKRLADFLERNPNALLTGKKRP